MNGHSPACPACGSTNVLYQSSFIAGRRECGYRCFACGYETPDCCASPIEADRLMDWVKPRAGEMVLAARVEAYL